jgi:hypothetical protein
MKSLFITLSLMGCDDWAGRNFYRILVYDNLMGRRGEPL